MSRAAVGQLSSPVLIGREDELTLMVQAVAQAPALVFVEGEAGVGKSRLVAELLAAPELARHRRLVGQCHLLREPFPLGPVLEALRRPATLPLHDLSPLVGALRALLPELAESLPPAPPPLTDPRAERHRVFRATLELLAACTPAVLVLEDLHWADETTLDFLAFLVAERLADLSVVVTYRREDLPCASALLGLASRLPSQMVPVRVTLSPLRPADVGRLVAAILDSPAVSDEFAGYLHQRTSGLPFAVEECLRLLQERGGIVWRDGRWSRRALEQLAVPVAVRDSIRERLDRLDPAARSVVEAVAVLDRGVSEEVVAHATHLQLDSVRSALAAAVRCGLLEELDDGRCVFRHALARDAVYSDLSAGDRRRNHLAAAHALMEAAADDPPVAQLAHHFRQAGQWRQAVAYGEAAADQAAAAHDDAAVCSFLLHALSIEELPSDTCYRLAQKLGRSASHSFDHAAAAAALRAAVAREDLEPANRGELRRLLGVMLVQSGNAAAGVDELKRAVTEPQGRPEMATRVMVSLAAPWVVEGDFAEHLDWLERADDLDRCAAGVVDRIPFLIDRATALVSLAHPDWREADAAVPADGTDDDQRRELHRGSLNLAQGQLYIGAYADAGAHLERASVLVAHTPSMVLSGLQLTTGVLLDWHTGAWDGLEQRAAALCAEMAPLPHARVDVEAVAGLLELARGRDAAQPRLDALLVTARDVGSLPVLAMAAGGLAAWHLACGRAAQSIVAARAALDVLVAKGLWGWLGDVVPSAVGAIAATGAPEDAQALRNEFAAAAERLDAPVMAAAVLSADAHLAEAAQAWRDAALAHDAAAAAFAALPRRYEALRSQAAAARCALEGHDAATPAAGLSILAELDTMSAAVEARRLTRALRRHGVTLPSRWRGGRRGYGDSLSPREAEVVELVAAGRLTREIADALFLSPRTVDFHVAKAMRKLGVRSRRDLAAAAEAKNP